MQQANKLLALASLVAGDHKEVVRLGCDPVPFPDRDFDLAATVDTCALAQEGDESRRSEPGLLGCISQGLIAAVKHLLVLLAARVPVHARRNPRSLERRNAAEESALFF